MATRSETQRRTRAENGASEGTSPKLSEAAIVSAARELISEVGVDGCTMRELSTRLGVALGATYHHVPNKERLLALVGRDVYRDIADGLPSEGDWKTRLRAAMIRTVELFGQYPGLASHVMTHGAEIQPEDPNIAIYTMLVDAGFAGEQIGQFMGSLFLFVGGMCMSERADLSSVGANLLGAEAVEGSLRGVFEAGLDMLIDGAELRL